MGVVRPGTSSESSDIVHIESLFFFLVFLYFHFLLGFTFFG